MSANPLPQEPREGDVLVIGTGEKASRHVLSFSLTGSVYVDPPFAGARGISPKAVDALLACGAATLEKKQEPYRAHHLVESLEGHPAAGVIYVPATQIGKLVEVIDVELAEDSTSIKSEGTV